MSDIHVLAGDGKDEWTLLFHYPVPDEVNQIGVEYKVALIASGLGGTSAMDVGTEAGQITAAEFAQIEAGELYEHSISFLAESGATNSTQMIAEARIQYTKHQARVTNRIQRALKYYGYAGDMP